MKKLASPKLKLHKETLRELEASDLARNVAGGVITRINCTTVTFTNWPTCDPIT
ncbi:MAG TPA: hypothetical protein VFE33_11480 [Thermoanaerobaculia bacterium]|nr:hypothetical protein [Thermoanaerobaculia bacterium]